jgi:hypothetical protein
MFYLQARKQSEKSKIEDPTKKKASIQIKVSLLLYTIHTVLTAVAMESDKYAIF